MRVGYFDTREFASPDGAESPFGEQVVSPKLLDLLNKLRDEYGKPLVVNSGYRSAEHNAKVGVVPNSQHVLGLAADIRPLSENMADLPKLQRMAHKLNSIGGVGYYNTFVHIDVRGKIARWDNRTK